MKVDVEKFNARLEAVIQNYLPQDGKDNSSYTSIVKPLRDVYRGDDAVRRMNAITLILGLAILFIAALNYVLISISSLSYRAKAVGVHKCNGASGGTVFSMFLLETGIIILLSLILVAFLLLNFREMIEEMLEVRLTSLFALGRISGFPPLHGRKERVEASIAFHSVFGCSLHLWADVCHYGSVSLCIE